MGLGPDLVDQLINESTHNDYDHETFIDIDEIFPSAQDFVHLLSQMLPSMKGLKIPNKVNLSIFLKLCQSLIFFGVF